MPIFILSDIGSIKLFAIIASPFFDAVIVGNKIKFLQVGEREKKHCFCEKTVFFLISYGDF